MREPYISNGFIIFRQGYESQLSTLGKGHYKTAQEWVKYVRLEDVFERVINDPNSNIHAYDDFLTDYVGAIRLYTINGEPRCYIPRGNNNEYKSYLKNFFISKIGKYSRYYVHGDVAYDEFAYSPNRELITDYTDTILYSKITGKYIYNPNRIGD